MIRDYIKLLRPKHYLKNALIFVPLIFSGKFNQLDCLYRNMLGFISFCLLASAIYIFNDIKDVVSDRKHEIKKNRPIASGKVTVSQAWTMMVIVLVASGMLNFVTSTGIKAWIYIMSYFTLNVMYSMGLKQVPLLDVAILVSGFLIRVLYGAEIINQEVSYWLYLTVMAMSFYLGLGKRRNELIKNENNAESVRSVLKYYNKNFLDKNMYICMALTIVFYSLWSVDPLTTSRFSNTHIVWTVPLVILICMKYSLNIETNTYADPVDVLLGDRWLATMVFFYVIVICTMFSGAQLLV